MLTRRLLPVLLTLLLVVPGSIALAKDEVRVEVNGAPLLLSSNQQPFLAAGVTMVPLRPIAEALQATIQWDQATSTVLLKRGSRAIRIQPGAATATVDGREVPLPAPAILREGTTFVPLRFVGQSLGAAVGWDGQRRLVTVLTELDPDTPATFASPGLELAVRAALGRARGPLRSAELARLTALTAEEAGITDLGGIEQLTGLRSLDLSGNQITDVSPLASLRHLEELDLAGNPIPVRFEDSVLASVLVQRSGTILYSSQSATSLQGIAVTPGLYQWIIHRDGYSSQLLTENVPPAGQGFTTGTDSWMLWYTNCTSDPCVSATSHVSFVDGQWRYSTYPENPPYQLTLHNPDGTHFAGLAPLAQLPNLRRLRFDRAQTVDMEPFRGRSGLTWEVALPEIGPSPAAARVRWEQLRPRFQGDPMLQPVSAQPPYQAGQLAPGFLADGLNMANFVRYLAGLPDDLELDPELNRINQHAAVLLSRIGYLDHYPDRPEDMPQAFYELGYEGTSHSNLSRGRRTLADSIRFGYMRDADPSNIDRVGHRRWVLSPVLKKVGFGFSPEGNFSAMHVFDASRAVPVDFEVIAWPASGWFPTEFFAANDPWSVSVNPGKYSVEPAEIRVTLKRLSDGRVWQFPGADGEPGAYFNVDTGNYGHNGPAIIFRPDLDAIRPGDRFEVTIEGVRSRTTRLPVQFRFQVTFYDLR